MTSDGVAFLLISGTVCVVFGLCMRPLWRRVRRARLRRRETLMLSTARARERWLWVNAFGSIALGAALIGAGQVGLYDLLRERLHREELARIEITCDSEKLILHNRGDAPRRVYVTDPTLYESEGWRSQRHPVSFVDNPPRVLQPGERVEIQLERVVWEPGADTEGCRRRPAIEPTLFRRQTTCSLRFALEIGELREHTGCDF